METIGVCPLKQGKHSIKVVVDNSKDIVDKMESLKKNLDKIMVEHRSELDAIIAKHLLDARTFTKDDGSPVTDLDLAISQKLEEIALDTNLNFYSEENIGQWEFPLMVVDPVDGTKEFIAGRDEWVVSVALLDDENLAGQGWIYNPLRKKIYSNCSDNGFVEKEFFYGEASRTEWAQGLYQKEFSQFRMSEMGSIAFKLARLASGEIDFVVSLKPKNVWDIAAGTLLCQRAGINFYAQGSRVEKFIPYFDGPLIWCRPELYSRLSTHFC